MREFPDAVFQNIRANQEDVRRFLEQAITSHSHRDPVRAEFMETIVAEIGDVQGMYQVGSRKS
jgi:hypothetical protein